MLTQEKRLGYKNKAVFGGLEKLASNWGNEALQEATTDEQRALINEITQDLARYSEVAEADRPHFIHRLLVKLHKAGGAPSVTREREAPVPPAAAPAKSPAPPSPAEPTQVEATPEVAPVVIEAQPEQVVPTPDPPPPSPRPPVSPRPSPPHAPRLPRESQPDLSNAGLDSSVTKLPGIKEAMAKKLANLGVRTIGDFLSLYPRRYDDYRTLKPINQLQFGEEVTIIAQVWETRQRDTRNGRSIVTTTLSDGTATIEVTWFNQPWLAQKLTPGLQLVISGKVDEYLGRLTFQSPDWEELDKNMIHTGRLVPVYPLTEGLTIKWLRNQIKATVDYWTRRLPDYLPEESRQRLGMLPLDEAIRQIHFPDDWGKLEAARRRLAFDELLLIQLGVLRQRRAWQAQQGRPVNIKAEAVEPMLQALPYQLTSAQRKALDEIVADLRRETPMSRLLQGDVGSGKTVVALAAMVLTVLDGGQAAILAPTEILAEQHFQGMSRLLASIGEALGRPFQIRLLTGSTPAAERKELLDGLANGQVDILVGTHAIIQGDVELKSLRLAVIDEQHRFGVEQRAALREKGFNPHMLVMTATPIPRTLALTLYGDLDLSIIDEMPPGRQIIETRWLTPRERERAYGFIQAQIEKGRQAFIICPLVEESEKTEAKSAVEEHKRLQSQIFPKLKLGLLHGRMKAEEKEKVMAAFRDREMHILVSTSVVEVGIDVPNATVILVEGANRFGLAQLHQFRGRVGRGEHQSYCLLLADNASAEAEQRLAVIERTSNGFELAEQDLQLRGPGEFFGTRQSGLPDLKLVKLSDTKLLELARQEAGLIFEKDPSLDSPQNRLLARQLANFWSPRSDLN
ncbi:MAG: ATP-dependent DNA helicase RecG [Anaerolineales bacterium]|nr:ATP-dependent DNA helicase RecG [Anaerolineales bacterium]